MIVLHFKCDYVHAILPENKHVAHPLKSRLHSYTLDGPCKRVQKERRIAEGVRSGKASEKGDLRGIESAFLDCYIIGILFSVKYYFQFC